MVKTAKLTIGIQRKDLAPGNNVGSVDLDITLPATFILPAAADTPTTMTALVAGVDIQQMSYVHPTLHLILLKATAFSTGNLITFTRTLQSGETLPTEASFQRDLIEVSEITETGDVTLQTQDYGITLLIEEI